MEQIKTYLTVKQMASKYPCFSEGAYRNLINKADENGLAPLIRRIGKKVLIDEAGFSQWIDERGKL